mmetsp:Transcript_43247/g.119585  ORF Transcript_43247/g.119585 Transcript_43247/m.119585 type:complete len:281 (+) Transcript_43247:89-931(+)
MHSSLALFLRNVHQGKRLYKRSSAPLAMPTNTAIYAEIWNTPRQSLRAPVHKAFGLPADARPKRLHEPTWRTLRGHTPRRCGRRAWTRTTTACRLETSRSVATNRTMEIDLACAQRVCQGPCVRGIRKNTRGLRVASPATPPASVPRTRRAGAHPGPPLSGALPRASAPPLSLLGSAGVIAARASRGLSILAFDAVRLGLLCVATFAAAPAAVETLKVIACVGVAFNRAACLHVTEVSAELPAPTILESAEQHRLRRWSSADEGAEKRQNNTIVETRLRL